MSGYSPSVPVILEAVREFIDGLRTELRGETKYHAQVCSYLLEMCEKELELRPGFERHEDDLLAPFVGNSSHGDDKIQALCRGIRAGHFDDQFDALAAAVLESVTDRVRVVKPRHLTQKASEARSENSE
jgi:hypothetical protein